MMKKTMLLASAAMIGVGFLAAHVKAQAVPEKDNLEQHMIAPSSEAEARGIADARATFADELKDPAIRDRLMTLTHKEVGSQGQQAQRALIETVINRAVARKQSLDQTMRPGYYQNMGNAIILSEEQRQQYGAMIDEVMAGANITNYATGNASKETDVGEKTFESQGERFGVENQDREWADRERSETPTAVPAEGDTQPHS